MAKKRALLPAEDQRVELKARYVEAFIASAFNHTRAMEAIGIKSRSTVWEWRKTDTAFARALVDAREREGDWYENQLRTLSAGIPEVDENGKLIGWKEKPEISAIQTVLNAKFRDRGYGYRVRHEIETGSEKESRIDLSRLTKEQRETWYSLLELATIPDDEIQDAEIIE